MTPPSPTPPRQTDLSEWLAKLACGEASVEQVLAAITASPAFTASPASTQQAIAGATVDIGRQTRCGFGEVIYGQGKSAELISDITKTQLAAGQNVLITRIDNKSAEKVQANFANAPSDAQANTQTNLQHNSVASTMRISTGAISAAVPLTESEARATPHVAVVTAGSTDAAVAQEAIETLTWMGIPLVQFDDIGVAGPQRLLSAVPRLQLASAVVVVAGMEGALPSVVAGHLSVPIFAVPTSVGYGATLGGITALLGMLCSCAAGVAVVNIDAGFKGGYMAGLVVSQLRKTHK